MKPKVKQRQNGGRPKKDIDPKLVFDLAMIHCTREEIASIVGCSRDTLWERFSDELQKGDDEGKRSLKRMMWKSASAGNITMQIWLAKQRLGHKDRQPDEVPNTVINVAVNPNP